MTESTTTENTVKLRKLYISDHAILRYLERVNNIDINYLKVSILNEELCGKYNEQPSKDCIIETNLCRFIVKDGTIVTVLSKNKKKKRRCKKGKIH